MKQVITLLILLMFPAAAMAVDADNQTIVQPRWSMELKGGRFAPALSDWAQYYGRKDMPEYAVSLAYKVRRRIEVGIEVGYAEAKGHALAPLHKTIMGDVTYNLYPVNVFVLLRGVVNEDQWLIPYAGGGFTRMYYKEQIEGQDNVRGSVDGYHARAGLQFLLDGLDRSAANNMYMDFGVQHTYLFIEGEYTHAVVRSAGVNLGGTSWLTGLLFEF